MVPRSKPSTAKRRPPDPIAKIGWIQTDCHDPERLAAFWGAVPGVDVEDRFGNPAQYVNLAPATPDGPRVCFQRVPEAKATKNPVHLDVAVQDVDVGGKRLPHEDYHEDGQYQPGPTW
jgi:hypothetical protein